MVELLVSLAEGLHGLHSLKMLVDTGRSNPQGTLVILILVLTGAAAALVMRRTRRGDFPSIR